MAVTDYNTKKLLDVDSVSGTPTIDKATPIIVTGEGEAYNIGEATFSQSISTQDASPTGLTWNNDGTKLYEIGNSDLIYEYDVSTAFDISTATFSQSISTQDASPTGLTWNNDGTKLYEIGDSSDLIYEYDVSTAFDISTATFSQSISTQDANPQGLTWNNDGTKLYEIGNSSDLIYEYDISTATESKTGNGDIIIDWTNVSAESDLAVYGQNGNLLPYEIEEFDATNETATLWCYDSWVRDGSTQAQVVYGNGPASSEEGTPAEVWGNTGQNAETMQHLNEDNYPTDNAIDSSPNGNDGTVNGVTSTSNGEFNGAGDYDGTDDYIDYGDLQDENGQAFTTIVWFKDSSNQRGGLYNFGTDGSGFVHFIDINNDADDLNDTGGLTYRVNRGEVIGFNPNTYNDGNWHMAALTYDGSSTGIAYADGSQLGSLNDGNATSNPGDNVRFGDDASQSPNTPFAGVMDEQKLYVGDEKDAAWIQAEYDASPKGGQVFFSQQAAEDTAVTVSGVANGSASLTGDATATNKITGTASGSATFNGDATATQTINIRAVATGNASLTGTADAFKRESIAATGSATLNGDAAASLGAVVSARATGTASLTGTATATKSLNGIATGTGNLTGNADGSIKVQISADGNASLNGTVTATTQIQAQADGSASFTADATASLTIPGLTLKVNNEAYEVLKINNEAEQ